MNIKKSKKANIKLGKKDLLKDEDFEPKNVRHRISIVVPEDVLMEFRKMAKEKGLGYQTLMNQVLREVAFTDAAPEVGKRLARLEKKVFGEGATR